MSVTASARSAVDSSSAGSIIVNISKVHLAENCLKTNQPLRVLIVDKCKDTTDSLKILLKFWGFDTEIAHDGQAAIATALSYKPDVILLDLALPKISGCDVVKRLRIEQAVPGALMVAVTGFADIRHLQQAREAGFDRYLIKPVDPLEIKDLLMRGRQENARIS